MYQFDRSKPFYPIVMNYVSQLHAIKELLVIGVLGTQRTWQALSNLTTEEKQVVGSAVDDLLGPLSLEVTDRTTRLEIGVDTIAKELAEHHSYLLPRQLMAAHTALVMAHEVTKGQPYRNADALWEFLRHTRNAAAHNARWSFQNGEPSRPASWRSITLCPSLDGYHLFRLGTQPGTLQLGDPIALLWDIEQTCPGMHL